MGKRSDYSGKGGRYNLMQDVPAGVQKSTGLQATWNEISEFKSELQQAVERGERITQSMLSPTAVPTASRDKQGIVFAWRDSINKLITPRMFHPGIDGITSWRADRGGSATPTRLAGGPGIVPAYAGATLAEQVNDGRVAVRCLSADPPVAGETLGCSGTLTASETPFAYRTVLAAFFRLNSVADLRFAIGCGTTTMPGTAGFGDTGPDTLSHAVLILNPGVNGGRWYLSSRTTVAGDQSSDDTGITPAVGSDTFVEFVFAASAFSVVINGVAFTKTTQISASGMDQWALGYGSNKVGGGAQVTVDHYAGYIARL